MKKNKPRFTTWNLKAPIYDWIRTLPGLSWILNAENAALERLLKEVHLFEDSKILDLGTGDGNVIRHLPEEVHKNIITLDASSVMLEQTRKKYPEIFCLQADAQLLPIQSSSIDLVTCIGLSEYVEDLSLLLKEIGRVLSTNGQLILTISPKSVFTYLRNLSGPKVYARSSEEIESLLDEYGFKVLEVSRTIMQVQYLSGNN